MTRACRFLAHLRARCGRRTSGSLTLTDAARLADYLSGVAPGTLDLAVALDDFIYVEVGSNASSARARRR